MSRRTLTRLGAIELLPRTADPAIAVAMKALQDHRTNQTDIYAAFCADLKAIGIENPPSKSTFSRWVMRVRRRRAVAASGGLSSRTRRLLAEALRSLVDDLEDEKHG